MTAQLQEEIERLSLDLHEARETIARLRKEANEWMLTAAHETDVAHCAMHRVKELTAAVEGLLNALPSATTHPAIQAARAALAQGEL